MTIDKYLLLAGALFVGSAYADETIARPEGLIYCSEGVPQTFNPQLTHAATTLDAISLPLYDRLLEVNPVTLAIEPGLASAWTLSDDGLTYTFTLRDKVLFHASPWFNPTRPFNADDVVFTFNRLLEPTHPYHQVSGGNYPYFRSLGLDNLIKRVSRVDERHVVFELNHPNASFLADLASSYAVMLSAEYGAQLLSAGTPALIDSRPIGTGPFKFKEYRDHQFIRYLRHDAYWRGAPRTAQLVFDITPRSAKRLTKLLTGECDVMSYPAASQVKVIQEHPELALSVQSGMNVSFIAINTRKAPFNDVRVRRAIAAAVNRSNLLQAVYFGNGDVARSLLPSLSWGFDPSLPQPVTDLKLARQLLKESKHEKGFDMTLLIPSGSRPFNPDPMKSAQLIRSDLAAIGIKVKIRMQESPVLDRSVSQAGYDAILGGWLANNSDPDNFFRQLLGCHAISGGSNLSRWCDPGFEQLLDDAVSTQQMGFRIRNYYYAQQILASEMPLIPLVHALQIQANRRVIQGLQISPLGGTLFNGAYRE